jgi:hypothetical protein
MTKEYNKGDVLYFNLLFIIVTRSCQLEYIKDGDRYAVTDHNLNVNCIKMRGDGTYQLEATAGGMSAVHFVNNTLRPIDESNARFFLTEFLRIKNTTTNHNTLAGLEALHKIFLKNQLFANQVTIHEED